MHKASARALVTASAVLVSFGCSTSAVTTSDIGGLDLGAGGEDLALPDSFPTVVDMASADLAVPMVTATASCNPNNVVTGTVAITVDRGASLHVDYGPDTTYGLSTPVATAGTGTLTVVLLGLRPGSTNHARVVASFPGGIATDSGDVAFDCPSLPQGMPDFTAVTGTPPANDFLFITALNTVTSVAVAALVDRSGKMYWYWPLFTLGESLRLPNGNFAVFQASASAYLEITPTGDVVRSYTDPLASRGADNHEFVPSSSVHALLLGQNVRNVDTSEYVDGGGPTTEVENTIAEVDADGGVVFHWSGGDHISLGETTSDISLFNVPIDAQHANSIDVLADGNLLLSLRHTDTLYKINRSTGDIMWRLGGKSSNFTFLNDPLNGFSHQHFARQLASGNILLFDDGNLHTPPNSRVVEYRVDEAGQTATMVWQHHHTPELQSFCCGSAERLSTGDTLTAWGTTGVIEQIDASSNVLWEMKIPNAIVYRAIRLPTLYP